MSRGLTNRMNDYRPSMGLRDEDPDGMYSGEVKTMRADEGIVWAKHNAARPGVEMIRLDENGITVFRALAQRIIGNKGTVNVDIGFHPDFNWLVIARSKAGHYRMKLNPNGSSTKVGGGRLSKTLTDGGAAMGFWVPVPNNEPLSKAALEAFRLYGTMGWVVLKFAEKST